MARSTRWHILSCNEKGERGFTSSPVSLSMALNYVEGMTRDPTCINVRMFRADQVGDGWPEDLPDLPPQ